MRSPPPRDDPACRSSLRDQPGVSPSNRKLDERSERSERVRANYVSEVGRVEVPSGLVRPVSDPAMSIPPGQRGVLDRREILPPDWSDEQP